MKQLGVNNRLTTFSSSNLKCSVSINSFKFFKFKIKRKDPSGFGIKKILEINCLLQGETSQIAPFLRRSFKRLLIAVISCDDQLDSTGGTGCKTFDTNGILYPLIQLKISLSEVMSNQ